jgi:ADP-ribosylglycohydrolase
MYGALTGLSVGDALGAQFFVPGPDRFAILRGETPPAPWPWTDDTEMSCVLVREALRGDGIDQDRLAHAFADQCDPYRGYGPGATRLLHRIRDGVPWPVAAREAFGGAGSCGNGAAMRVAPLGAWYAGDPAAAGRAALRQAEVTHQHVDGVAGAVAVAAAAAVAAGAAGGDRPEPGASLAIAADLLVPCGTARALHRALALLDATPEQAAYELGTGSQSTSQDTVGFALWVADRYLTDYPAAVATCIAAGGDMDTTAAIAGGVVAGYGGAAAVPARWRAAREPLPGWLPVPADAGH